MAKSKRLANESPANSPEPLKPNEPELNLQEPIPESMRIESSGAHLYLIGATFYRMGTKKRPLIHHPIVVFLTTLSLLIRFTYSVCIDGDRGDRFYLLIGDYGYFMNMQFHLNMTAALVYNMSIWSQILHYYYWLAGRQPSYLKVFTMMSGVITPASIGLTNERLVRDLLGRTRLVFKSMDFLSYSMSSCAFFISFFSYIWRVSFLDFITLGLLHTMHFFIGSYFIFRILTVQILYFYILSYYVVCKQKAVNDYLRECIGAGRPVTGADTDRVTRSLHYIYLEIMSIDGNYWSRFLGVVWVTSSAVIALIIFMFAFGYENMSVNITIILVYATFFFSLLLIILIDTCATVCLEAKRTYKLLATYKLVTMRARQSTVVMARHGFKFLNLFERIGIRKKNKVGFSCAKLFIINYFRGYEVIALCAIVLLRIIQMELTKRSEQLQSVSTTT